MSMSGVTKALTTVNRVTKSATKVFVKSLPIISIATNVAEVASTSSDLPNALNNLLARYTGFNAFTGEFRLENAAKGAGTLIGATVVSKIVQAFT